MGARSGPRFPLGRSRARTRDRVVAVAALGFPLAALLAWRLSRRPAAIVRTVSIEPDRTRSDSTGAVRSVQAADLVFPAAELDRIWSPMNLERLARTYWRFLNRVTLGTIRVLYTSSERRVVLLVRPLRLLRFREPEYAMNQTRGIVRWRIRDGILVARRGHDGDGYLQIDIERRPAAEPGSETAHVEVEVANFYPALAQGISTWFYKETQSRIHVLVTHGFLRSLARLDLAESRVGRLAAIDELPDPPPPGQRTPLDGRPERQPAPRPA